MRNILVGVSSLLILTGCGQFADKSWTEACSIVMSDPDVQRDILEASVTVESYCTCTSQQVLALPDASRDTAIETLEMVAGLMGEHNGSAEAAFRQLSEARRADDATPEAIAAYENMDELGEQLEEYLDGMRAAGGTCPV